MVRLWDGLKWGCGGSLPVEVLCPYCERQIETEI